MKTPEEIYDFMLEHHIGGNRAATYKMISNFYIDYVLDFEKAEIVFQRGFQLIAARGTGQGGPPFSPASD